MLRTTHGMRRIYIERVSHHQPGILNQLKDFGTNVAAFVGAIAADDFPAAASAAPGVIKSFQALNKTHQSPVLNPDALKLLRSQLATVTEEFEDFSNFVSAARTSYLTAKISDIYAVLNARHEVQRTLQSESFMGPDILKVALISYLADIAKKKNQLRNNLDQIRSYFEDFPKDVYVNLSDIDWGCTDAASCMTFEADPQRWRLVTAGLQLPESSGCFRSTSLHRPASG